MLNAAFTGTTVTQVRDGIYLIDVVARAEGGQRALSTLRTLQVPLPNGRTVPLTSSRPSSTQDYPLVWRRDRVPTLTVQADVARGLAEPVVDALAPAIANQCELPPATRSRSAASPRRAPRSQASVFAVVPLMLFLMLILLMIQLQSFQRLFLVMSVVPLGLIGVVAALLFSGSRSASSPFSASSPLSE